MATKRRLTNEINAGSMADIAFLLLIFFLVTTTISEDKGVLVKLPPWTPDAPPPVNIARRNVYPVFVNASGKLLVRGEAMDIGVLKDHAKTFISNPLQDKNLAENPNKAVIVLKNDRGTAYGAYLEVYDVLKAAYRELWDESALAKYGKELGSLSAARQKEIKNEIPMVISEHEPTEFGKED